MPDGSTVSRTSPRDRRGLVSSPEDPRGATSLRDLGPRPWLVLGGGGLKGLAHTGAWRALVEKEAKFSGIVGTSIGALVGALIAGGMSWQEMFDLALGVRRSDIVRINRRAAFINGIRQPSLFHDEPLREYIERVLPVREWAGLEPPLHINAMNLGTGRTVWMGTGANVSVSLADAVYASSALPVFYPPAEVDGLYLVDGGAAHPLPLARAAELGATGIVAVDVGSGEDEDVRDVVEQGMLAIHQRVFSDMAGRLRRVTIEEWNGPPLVLVRPRLDGYGTFDFDSAEYFVEEGHRATLAALRRGARTRATVEPVDEGAGR